MSMKLNFTNKLLVVLLFIGNGLLSQINSADVRYWLGSGADTNYIALNFNNQYNNTNHIWGYLSDGTSTVEDILFELSNEGYLVLETNGGSITKAELGFYSGLASDTSVWYLSSSDDNLQTWNNQVSFLSVISDKSILGLSFDDDINTGADYLNPVGEAVFHESPYYMDDEVKAINSYHGTGDLFTVVVFDFYNQGFDTSLAFGVRFNEGDFLLDALNQIKTSDSKFSFTGDVFINTISYDTLQSATPLDYSRYWSVFSNDLSDDKASDQNNGNSTVLEEGHYYSYAFGVGATARKFNVIEGPYVPVDKPLASDVKVDAGQIRYWLGSGRDTSYVMISATSIYDNTSKVYGFLHDEDISLSDALKLIDQDDVSMVIDVNNEVDSVAYEWRISGNNTDTSSWNVYSSNTALSDWVDSGTDISAFLRDGEVFALVFNEDESTPKSLPKVSLVYKETATYHDDSIRKVKHFVGEGEYTTVVLVDFKKPNVNFSLAYGVRFSQGQTLQDLLDKLAKAYDGFDFELGTFGLDHITIDTLDDTHFTGEYWSYTRNDLTDDLGSEQTNLLDEEIIKQDHYYTFVYAKETAQNLRPIHSPRVTEDGSSAIHKDSSSIVAWATGVSVKRGKVNIANPSFVANGSTFASFGSDDLAVGVAQGKTTSVVSLGDRGEAIVTFDSPIMNGEGYDFAVFENGLDNGSGDFLEFAFVEVSSDGINYYRFPSSSEQDTTDQILSFGTTDTRNYHNLAGKYYSNYGTPFDLDDLLGFENDLDLNAITHVKLIDVVGSINPSWGSRDTYGRLINDPFSTNFDKSGFDLDGVGVINENAAAALNVFISEEQMLVYPNPASETVTFVVEDEIKIYSISGQLMVVLDTNSSPTYSVSELGLETGVYIVKSGGLAQKLMIK